MLIDKNGNPLKAGDFVKFELSQNNPNPTPVTTFEGTLEEIPAIEGLCLKIGKGVLVWEDDGEPCYELEKL